MNILRKKCPKCKGEMERGIIRTDGRQPEINWGKNSNRFKKNNIPINTFVCIDCGLVENYIPFDLLKKLKEPAVCFACSERITREIEMQRCKCGKAYHMKCVVKDIQCRSCEKIW